MNLIYKNLVLYTSLYISTMDKFIKNKSIFLADENIILDIKKIRVFLEEKPFLLLNMLNDNGIITIKDQFKDNISSEYIRWLERSTFYFLEHQDSLKFWDSFFYLLKINFGKNPQFIPSKLMNEFINGFWKIYDKKLTLNKKLYRKEFIFLNVEENSIEKTQYLYSKLSKFDKFIYDIFMEYDDEGFEFIYGNIEDIISHQHLFYLFDDVIEKFSDSEIIDLSNEFDFFIDNYITIFDEVSDKKISKFQDILKLAVT